LTLEQGQAMKLIAYEMSTILLPFVCISSLKRNVTLHKQASWSIKA